MKSQLRELFIWCHI